MRCFRHRHLPGRSPKNTNHSVAPCATAHSQPGSKSRTVLRQSRICCRLAGWPNFTEANEGPCREARRVQVLLDSRFQVLNPDPQIAQMTQIFAPSRSQLGRYGHRDKLRTRSNAGMQRGSRAGRNVKTARGIQGLKLLRLRPPLLTHRSLFSDH